MVDQTSQFYAILTTVGAAKQANADALGIPWKITHMAVGDGNPTGLENPALPMPDASARALLNEWRRAPLNQLKVDDKNSAVIVAEQVIPADVGGRWIRELALFDTDGDMVAVANCAPTYKPLLNQGSGRTQVVRMNLIVSSASNVQLKIDPSVVLATREWVTEELAKQDFKHSVMAATTTPITLSGLQTVDGVALSAGARVLVKNQAAGKDNGLYLVVAGGAWMRSSDADINANVTPGMLVLVEKGSVNGDSGWQLVTDGPITLGVSTLAYEMVFGRTGVVGGTYRSVSVDAYGRVVAASNPTTVAGFGLTDVYTKTQIDQSLALKANLADPTFTGIPKVPTALALDWGSAVANTKWVQDLVQGLTQINVAGEGDFVLSSAQANMGVIYLVGALSGNRVVILPQGVKRYLIRNATSQPFKVTVKMAAGAGVEITQGRISAVFTDGAHTLLQQTDFTSTNLLGVPTCNTAPIFSTTTQIANTDWVARRGVQYSNFFSYKGATAGIAADVGGVVHFSHSPADPRPNAYSLPNATANNIPAGATIRVQNWGIYNMSLERQGADQMQESIDGAWSAATRIIPPDSYVDCMYIGSNCWLLTGTGVMGKTRPFQASLTTGGFQKLPSGLIIQWNRVMVAQQQTTTFTLPIVFPNAFLACTAIKSYAISTAEYSLGADGTVSTVTITNTGPTAGSNQGAMYIAIGY